MRKMLPLIATLAVALALVAAFGAVTGRAYADNTTPPAKPEDYAGPEKCATCHAEQAQAWQGAPHADAFKVKAFKDSWEAVKSPGYCLACHTTGYDPNTGTYAFEGVTCESCHGPFVEGHPQKPMEVNSSPEACGTCHRSTLNEWQLSQHGEERIGCVNCHDPHGQTIKAGESGELCVKCHSEQKNAAMHASAAGENLKCEDCHIGPRAGDPAEGHAETGHTFKVGTSTCSRCHANQIHEGVAVMMGGATPAPTATTPAEGGEATQTQARATEIDQMFALPMLGSGVVGLGLGAVIMFWRSRNRKH